VTSATKQQQNKYQLAVRVRSGERARESSAMANQSGCVDASEVEPVGKSADCETSSRPLNSGGREMAVKEEEQPTGVRHPAGNYACRISKLINWKRPLWTSAFFVTTNIAFW